MNDGSVGDRPHAEAEPDNTLRHALLDSRQRWRDLVTMAADLAYETDEWGRLTFVMPDPALGWAADTLIGQPAELLLSGGTNTNGFNPFRVTAAVRRRRAWLNQSNGTPRLLAFSAAPLVDSERRIVGSRGVGVDWTESDMHQGRVAASLRRGEVLDHIIWSMGQEVMAPRMMQAALHALMNALGGEGAAVIDLRAAGEPALVHEAGGGGREILASAAALLAAASGPLQTVGTDRRPILVAICHTRFGSHAGLAVWRAPCSRAWDHDDRLLVEASANVIRMVLEHEAIQQEMGRQARTDPLTGLLNRRAFLDELGRHIDRLDRENQPGTLMFADLDSFKPVNDRLGHEAGDQVLVRTAAMLQQAVRPSDLVARLGGDEFALWMNGADHMTAAERAEWLVVEVPKELRPIAGDAGPTPTISIGIATRLAGSGEPIDNLLRRADRAMYKVKRGGRGRWLVSQGDET
jgi:diguanylate cyclase (GGDEF)-like protein